jgi:hypothetical protein
MAALIVDHQTTNPSSTLDHTSDNQTLPPQSINHPPTPLITPSIEACSGFSTLVRPILTPSYTPLLQNATLPSNDRLIHPANPPLHGITTSFRDNRSSSLPSSYIYRNKQNPNQVTTCYVFPPTPLFLSVVATEG